MADKLTRIERILISSPSYRHAPPIKAQDGDYDKAIERWRTLYGGDDSKLVIEKSTDASPIKPDEVPEEVGINRQVTPTVSYSPSRNMSSGQPPFSAADFIALAQRDRLQNSSRNPSVGITRAESLPTVADHAESVLENNQSTWPKPNASTMTSPTLFQKVEEEILLKPLPPPPQRPYTVEWIVNTPQRGHVYNSEANTFESEAPTPIPDFTALSSPSLPTLTSPILPPPTRPRHQMTTNPLPTRPTFEQAYDFSSSQEIIVEKAQPRILPQPQSRPLSQPIPSGIMSQVAEPEAEGDSVSHILFSLDELDERKSIKTQQKEALAKIHRKFSSVIKELKAAFASLAPRAQREILKQRRQAFEQEEEKARKKVTSHESDMRAALQSDVNIHETSSLKTLKTQTADRSAMETEENTRRRIFREDEHARFSEMEIIKISEANVAHQAVLLRRSAEQIKLQNDNERGLFESYEAGEREDIEKDEEQGWFQLYISHLGNRPMNVEDYGHRRASLGIFEELIHDHLRLNTSEELASQVSEIIESRFAEARRQVDDEEQHSSNMSSAGFEIGESTNSLPTSTGDFSREKPHVKYLREMYTSKAAQERKLQYGYNRNGWFFTPSIPDPLLFVGVQSESGELLGASSPDVKKAVKEFLAPREKGYRPQLPDGTILLKPAASPDPPIDLSEKEDEMKNILKNIKKCKETTWRRHTSSVRDRPPFPQDSQWEIYRREPGPNMGNAKRYQEEIEEQFRGGNLY